MEKPKIYLETTIFNFPFADDAPQYQADTLRLFEEMSLPAASSGEARSVGKFIIWGVYYQFL